MIQCSNCWTAINVRKFLRTNFNQVCLFSMETVYIFKRFNLQNKLLSRHDLLDNTVLIMQYTITINNWFPHSYWGYNCSMSKSTYKRVVMMWLKISESGNFHSTELYIVLFILQPSLRPPLTANNSHSLKTWDLLGLKPNFLVILIRCSQLWG